MGLIASVLVGICLDLTSSRGDKPIVTAPVSLRVIIEGQE